MGDTTRLQEIEKFEQQGLFAANQPRGDTKTERLLGGTLVAA